MNCGYCGWNFSHVYIGGKLVCPRCRPRWGPEAQYVNMALEEADTDCDLTKYSSKAMWEIAEEPPELTGGGE